VHQALIKRSRWRRFVLYRYLSPVVIPYDRRRSLVCAEAKRSPKSRENDRCFFDSELIIGPNMTAPHHECPNSSLASVVLRRLVK